MTEDTEKDVFKIAFKLIENWVSSIIAHSLQVCMVQLSNKSNKDISLQVQKSCKLKKQVLKVVK